MEIMSFQNPWTYVITILLILVAYILYRLATKKEVKVNTIHNGNLLPPEPELDELDFLPNTIILTPQKEVKFYTLQNSKKIIPNFFSNGSCLVIDNDGRQIRKKRKYCHF